MTGGLVVILGPVGRNFGAGMTGGRAWIWDPAGVATLRLDARSVAGRHAIPSDSRLVGELRDLLVAHAAAGSTRAAAILARWPQAVAEFVLVEPTTPTVVAVPAPAPAPTVVAVPVPAG
jgi:glutamate synthase domain-containing protein 3